jgi:hypothetical protein
MDSAYTLLATLAQSSTAIVAIVGGFLVSRLVALSSEREGIRRQLRAALDREALTRNDYEPIHQARLENSKDQFFDAVIDEIIEAEGKHVNLDELTEENIRRGSSFEELRPYAEELNTLVATACKEVEAKIKPGDDRRLSLEDLQARGLQVGKQSIDLYEQVVYHYAEQLPNNSIGLISPLITPFATPSWRHEIDARRLDESISAEAQLKGELLATEKEIQRLKDELQRIGKPVGVVSAVWVLGLLSLLGIVFPVVVMATEPETLSPLLRWLLVSSFIIGLIGLLAYTVWYHRQLNGQERG